MIDEDGHVLAWACVCGQTLTNKPNDLLQCCEDRGWVATELDTEDPYREAEEEAMTTFVDPRVRAAALLDEAIEQLEIYTAAPGRFDVLAHRLIADLVAVTRRVDALTS